MWVSDSVEEAHSVSVCSQLRAQTLCIWYKINTAQSSSGPLSSSVHHHLCIRLRITWSETPGVKRHSVSEILSSPCPNPAQPQPSQTQIPISSKGTVRPLSFFSYFIKYYNQSWIGSQSPLCTWTPGGGRRGWWCRGWLQSPGRLSLGSPGSQCLADCLPPSVTLATLCTLSDWTGCLCWLSCLKYNISNCLSLDSIPLLCSKFSWAGFNLWQIGHKNIFQKSEHVNILICLQLGK